MEASGISQKSRKLFIVLISVVAGQLLMFFLLGAAHALVLRETMVAVSSEDLVGIFFTFNAVAYQNYCSIHICIIYVVYLRLSLISNFLNTVGKNQQNFSVEDILKKLKVCAELVDKVCDTLESIKFCYTVNTVNYILHYSFYTIISLYSIVSYTFRTNATRSDLIYVLLNISWNIYFAPFFICLFLLSNCIKKLGKKIESQIHKILSESRHELKVYKRANMILMQLSHERPLVSCGVFVIDWYLLFFFMDLCFSYLVIAVQFEWKTFSD